MNKNYYKSHKKHQIKNLIPKGKESVWLEGVRSSFHFKDE